MLGDVAVAIHPEDERYLHLHGKKLRLPLMNREIPIILDDWVSRDFGTGAVKVTPAHDPNDFALGQRHNLPSINVMDETAHINAEGGAYAGLDRYVARKNIVADLEEQGLLAGIKDHTNNVGHCDRCKTVVEPRLSLQWFVKIQPLADKAIAAVKSKATSGSRPEMYEKTYLNWMENIHDWCISRQLWWGHRIPAWHCATCHKITVPRATIRRVRPLRLGQDHPGNRRSRHVVLLGPAARFRLRLAQHHDGEPRRLRRLLSHQPARHRLRHPLLLGSPHDHARLLVRGRCAHARREPALARRIRSPSARSTSTPWCATPTAKRCRRPRATSSTPSRSSSNTAPMRCASRWPRWPRPAPTSPST